MAAVCKLRGAGMVLGYGYLLDPRNAHGLYLLPGLRVGYSKITVLIILLHAFPSSYATGIVWWDCGCDKGHNL